MNKKLIRLTESDLHRIVKESVNRVLKEGERRPFLKQAYENLLQAMSDFEYSLEGRYDMEGEGVNKILQSFKMTQEAVDDFVRHPDLGGSYKIWDRPTEYPFF
jgi:hypothetical protein